jgi:hypothetical protein
MTDTPSTDQPADVALFIQPICEFFRTILVDMETSDDEVICQKNAFAFFGQLAFMTGSFIGTFAINPLEMAGKQNEFLLRGIAESSKDTKPDEPQQAELSK